MRRRSLVLAGAAVLAAVTAGCGIRTTSVPVDAGGAPSRMSCDPPPAATPEPEPGAASEAARTSAAPRTEAVYLVCASGLATVDRTLRLPTGGGAARVAAAQALLDALAQQPSEAERQAGFATYVQGPLTVSEGRDGDPEGALRLSRQPEDLAPAALSQIVCTYAGAGAVAAAGAVPLGGPGDYPVRHYVCDRAVRERPESPVPTRSA
ncbi:MULTISPECIES: hypothetical protein [unclassified Streptomyces]|uniref:hypothetical protein n=1 Tax=unclassified Streptomyces TaxID=2593676 RepID=UPI0008DE47CC|nr:MULTISPECIES: hypothetical protein [unclassified Streptomyces]OII67096.1 hypothetical protein BJP39_26135 [Streptomyces sp. CC77]